MASNYTSNYQLCQWESTDQVVRTDFNADNAKLDAGLKTAQDTAEAAKALAETAYTTESPQVVVGVYMGNNTAKHEIVLGFRPKAVLISDSGSQFLYNSTGSRSHYAALALDGHNACTNAKGETAWVEGTTLAAVTEQGFQVATFAQGTSICSALNYNGIVYYYLALR